MTKEVFLDIVQELANLLKDSVFENHVYAVGGSVRDYVMENEIKDIDLVVDLPNGGIDLAKHLSMNQHLVYAPVLYPTYGTCQFRLKSFPDYELEAVHTRGEQYHDKNSRNPETFFADIYADSIRRDLTINALYYDIFKQTIVDPTGKGLADIKNHIIRTSNENPNIVFDDDPLRILRVIRFASKYDWDIAKETYDALCKYVDRLDIISQERITAEFVHMIDGPNPYKSAKMLMDTELWEKITYSIIDTQTEINILTAYMSMSHSLKDYSLYSKLAIAFNVYSVEMTKTLMHDMKFSNNDIKHVCRLIRFLHAFDVDCSLKHIREVQINFEDEAAFDELLDTIWILDKYSTNIEKVKNLSKNINMYGYKLPVTGDDVMREFNIESGPMVKDILHCMYQMAFENPEITYDELVSTYKEII